MSTPGPLSDRVSHQRDNAYGIEIRVFEGVENAAAVREHLDQVNSVAAWACAVDLAQVASPAQLISAAAKVSQRVRSQGPFKTGSARGDLYYYSSHHTSIGEALGLMQISSDTADVAIVSINGDEAFLGTVYGLVAGRAVNTFEWFAARDGAGSDGSRIQALGKFYKLTPQELKVSSVQDSVLTKIAVKEYIK